MKFTTIVTLVALARSASVHAADLADFAEDAPDPQDPGLRANDVAANPSLRSAVSSGLVDALGKLAEGLDAHQLKQAQAMCVNMVYCKDGMAHADDTFAAPTGGTCTDACGGNCCIGNRACDGGQFTVCADADDGSCDGTQACYRVGYNDGTAGLIAGGSCKGNQACSLAGANGGTVGDITGGSCDGNHACNHLGSRGNMGNVGDRSCTGNHACTYNAADGGTIGNIFGESCEGTQSCQGMGYGGQSLVGDIYGSCNQNLACNDVGRGTAWNRSIINCCNSSPSICRNVGNVYDNDQSTIEEHCADNTLETDSPTPAPPPEWEISAMMVNTNTGQTVSVEGMVSVTISGTDGDGI